ncbi:flavodoxin family protein [Salinisphaera hydrothermalis]|uniref:Flavodoxin related protein n=1 Tax=Salinisphaera hydrothermalis (strain C41B8) TaxID=1304275 RepID=A0A084IHG4_SALHC|nr:hypothetical protein [Salinisphaera hydrothermalis]KEZ76148.1 flavodoxin related protein [Salinisphaera hydrothermalis C41B8]
MNTLIVYYSLTGTTQTVATALGRKLEADVEALHCDRYTPDWRGMLRAGYDSWRHHLPALARVRHDPSNYALVIVGGPIWTFHPCTPVRAYLQQERTRLPQAAFFLTHGGSAGERCLREMETLSRHAPVATMVLREADVKGDRYGAAVTSFADSLRRAESKVAA